MPYKLSATLAAHKSDVRSVASPTNDLILSASRDATAISWNRTPGTSEFSQDSVFTAGSRYVNSVAYLAPTADAPKGYVVTGGQDTVINVFSLDAPKKDPDYSLLGHTENVCALATTGGTIVSGSWDRTAKIWKNFQLAYELKGHQQSVWAVLAVDEDQTLTGSADKTIKLWNQHKLITTFNGHSDAVRGLALVPDIGFASCSNDSEIRVWTYGGDLVYTLSGHTSFVYSLSVLPNGDIVSGGEDRSVRVWKDGECTQTLVHPAISVWSVSSMPNGDIISGSSDGVVRVFSASEDRWASEAQLKEYEDKVANQAVSAEQVGDLKKSNLPGPDALNNRGSKIGEQKLILDTDGQVWMYTWDGMNWEKIGTVVDAVGQSRKQLYEGKEYDYVFDVDIQDGVPPLKLPYNVTDNPFSVAQQFLAKNDLPPSYLDQVVGFIEQNTKGVQLGTGGDDYVDPFTGASRYRGSAGVAAQGPSSSFVDPYTGASRYSGSSTPSPAPAAPASSYMDPFTGASRYSGAPAVSPPSTNVLPSSKVITFKQVKDVNAIQGKMYELDGAFRQEISTSSFSMYSQEISSIDETFTNLSHLTSSPPEIPPTSLTAAHVDAIIQVLERWPPSQCFPVIDLSRLLTGYCPQVFLAYSGARERLFEALFKAAEWNTSWNTPLPKTRETNVLLVLKALANVFQEGYTPDRIWLPKVFSLLDQVPYNTLGKAQRAAYAAVLFNISCLILKTPLDPALRDHHFTLLLRVIKSENVEAEAAYRGLVGLGNAIHASKASLSASQKAEIAQMLATVSATFRQDSRIQNITKEIQALL